MILVALMLWFWWNIGRLLVHVYGWEVVIRPAEVKFTKPKAIGSCINWGKGGRNCFHNSWFPSLMNRLSTDDYSRTLRLWRCLPCDSVMMNKPSFLRDRTKRKRYETWRFLLLSPFGPLMRIDPGLLTPSCLTVVWCTTFCSLSFGGYSPASLSDITSPRIQCDVIAAWS